MKRTGEDTAVLTIRCTSCHNDVRIEVPYKNAERWAHGASPVTCFFQHVTLDELATIVWGVCEPCGRVDGTE